jgi:hypothetical protein
MATLTTPPLNSSAGLRGGYRLWTAAHGLDFDAMPERGAQLVPFNGWHAPKTCLCRSQSSASVVAADDNMVTLGMWRGDAAKPQRHALDGTKYPTHLDANRAAYNAGAMAFMVYEDQAGRFGLPTA